MLRLAAVAEWAGSVRNLGWWRFGNWAGPARLRVLRRPRRPSEYLRFALGACLLFVPPAMAALWSSRARPGSVTASGLYRGNRRASVFRLIAWTQAGVPLHILIFGLGGPTDAVLLVAALPVGAAWLLLLTQGFFAVKLAELLRPPAHGRRASFYRLLEDALDRQVLRQEGMYYQFRWPPLQKHLAALAAAESSRLRAEQERRQAPVRRRQATHDRTRARRPDARPEAARPGETGRAAATAGRRGRSPNGAA